MLLSVGFSRGCITPKDNVSIYNLDGQSRNSKDILDDLYVNTIVLESDERLLLFISLDIIWVDYKFTKRIKDRLYSEIGISDSNILICATHSHSTPQIAYHVNNEARPDKSYIDLIINIVCERSIFSFNNRVSAKARYSSFSTNLSVNRRKEVIDIYRLKKFSFEKKIANRPNLDGPLDDSLSILAFYSFSGHIICALINFACHPTMNRRNSVSSDFPGQLNKILMDNFGDNFVSCFMQGFSGNVKALSIVNSKFSIKKPFKSIIELLFDPIKFKKDMDITEIQNYSKSLFNKINWDFEWKNINPKFSSNNILLNVNTSQLSTGSYNNDVCTETTCIRFQRIDISDELTIVAVNGEVFTEYAIWIREALNAHGINVMPVGCSGGMIGYIPDKLSIKNGGYEVDRALYEFGRDEKFSCNIERDFKNAIMQLFDEFNLS